ncbi:hypothetical protein AB7M33_000292 [Pseudomonas sp. Y3 TE3536]
MNINAKIVQMLFAGLLVGSSAGQTVQASGTQAQAVIRFSQFVNDQVPSGKQCSVPAPAVGANAKQFKMDGCGNDVATYFKFENVLSSTVVTLISERSCSYDGDWWFDVRAIKHPTTSLWYDIRKLKHNFNTIVTPGVMRLGGKDHDFIEGKLSCVVIRSPSK